MADQQPTQVIKPKMPIVEQISAGGVAIRFSASTPEIAIVRTGATRWQLPKGIVDSGESPEQAAVREVREEAGIETDLITPINTIEYWYVGNHQGQRVRFHKFVHFFLLSYRSGDIHNHDWEVQEARWVGLEDAIAQLTFKSEQNLVKQAQIMLKDRLTHD